MPQLCSIIEKDKGYSKKVIEEVYNQKRLHSALGYRSPHDFEKLALIQESNGLPRQTLLTLPVQS